MRRPVHTPEIDWTLNSLVWGCTIISASLTILYQVFVCFIKEDTEAFLSKTLMPTLFNHRGEHLTVWVMVMKKNQGNPEHFFFFLATPTEGGRSRVRDRACAAVMTCVTGEVATLDP